MKPTVIKTTLGAALALAITASYAFAAGDAKIKDIMKAVMKGDNSTYKAVCTGKGSDADAQKLAKCLQGLAGTKAPKGDAASWNEKVTALIKAADDVAAKKPGAAQALQKAGNCKACHSAHKSS